MNKSIETVITSHKNWLVKNGARILARDSKYLLEDLDDASYQAFQQIPDSLNGLATYFGIRGAIDLLEGRESGWFDISTSIDFSGWELRIRAELFFRDKGTPVNNFTNYVSRTACLACISSKWGDIAENLLRRISDDSKFVDQEYWKVRRFEPFVLRLLKILNGETAPFAENIAEPYGQVIAAWNDESILARALDTVCEYHCQNMDDVGGNLDPEFKHPPFDLIPCEVIIAKRVREKFGLPTPEVKHEIVSLLKFDPSKIELLSEHEFVNKISNAFEITFSDN